MNHENKRTNHTTTRTIEPPNHQRHSATNRKNHRTTTQPNLNLQARNLCEHLPLDPPPHLGHIGPGLASFSLWQNGDVIGFEFGSFRL